MDVDYSWYDCKDVTQARNNKRCPALQHRLKVACFYSIVRALPENREEKNPFAYI